MKLPKQENNEESENGTRNGTNNGTHHSPQVQAVNTVPPSVHDGMIQGAIDAMFSSPEQTYQQFLQGFSHLTVADIAHAHMSQLSSEELPSSLSELLPSNISTSPSTVAPGPTEGTVDSELGEVPTEVPKDTKESSDDDLQEEILEEGTVTVDPLMRSADMSSAATLKVDNFVTFDGNDEDEDCIDDIGGSYEASFADTTDTKPSVPDPCIQPHTADKVSCEQECSVSSKPESLNPVTELSTNKDAEATLSEDVDEQSSCVKNDIAHNAKKWDDFRRQISDSEDEELKYDATLNGLNPGEVEEEEADEKKKPAHDTRLDFVECTKPDDDCSGAIAKEIVEIPKESCSDDVQPFSLDDDFDYDNVTLTPKYSAAEMTMLADLLKKNIKPSRVPYAPTESMDQNSSEEES